MVSHYSTWEAKNTIVEIVHFVGLLVYYHHLHCFVLLCPLLCIMQMEAGMDKFVVVVCMNL